MSLSAIRTLFHPIPVREARRVLLLVILTVLVWCGAHNRWSVESWQIPLQYGTDAETGDTKGVLAMMKSASDGNFTPLLPKYQPRLGAPEGAFWDDIPNPDQFEFWLPGLAARVVGLFAAANLAVLFAQILAAVAFYAASRALGVGWTWAAAGGLLFAFSRMASARMIHHLPVTYYWHVPLGLLVCYWIADGSLRFRSRKMTIAFAVAVVTGIQNPYYTAMFIQLMAVAALIPFFRRNVKGVLAAVMVAVVAVGAFLAMSLPTVLFKLTHGPNPGAIVRNYQWLEFFALKPMDLIMPPPDHPMAVLRAFREAYQSGVLIAGEVPPSSYLGIVGIAALFWLFFCCVRNAASSPARALPLEAGQVLYIAAFSIVGGLNGFAGALGFQFFRSTNRYSIFILAIVLLFAARSISSLRLSRFSLLVLPALLAIVGLLDQLPPVPTGAALFGTADLVDRDRDFVSRLEEGLPRDAMVFQLPFTYFPEASAPGLPAYEHFMPFLYSRTLKYSYGHVKGRGLEDWQKELFTQPPQKALDELQAKGFRAITIYRPAFQDNANGVIDVLEKTGRFRRIDHAGGKLTALIFTGDPSGKGPGDPP